jgi:hypothetical protein
MRHQVESVHALKPKVEHQAAGVLDAVGARETFRPSRRPRSRVPRELIRLLTEARNEGSSSTKADRGARHRQVTLPRVRNGLSRMALRPRNAQYDTTGRRGPPYLWRDAGARASGCSSQSGYADDRCRSRLPRSRRLGDAVSGEDLLGKIRKTLGA